MKTNKYFKKLDKNIVTIGNCMQLIYKNIARHEGRQLYLATKREQEQKQKIETAAPFYRRPYKLPALNEIISRHVRFAAIDTQPFVNAIDVVFSENRIPWKLENITQGPSITQVKVSLGGFKYYDKVMRLEKQFQAAMNIPGIRVSQSGSYVSIEIPYEIDTLKLGDILQDEKYAAGKGLTVAIGRAIDGDYVLADIDKLKHVLVAGASGSGKSVFIQGLIISLLGKHTPDDIDLFMIDPKMVEFSFYKPLAQCHVVTETRDAINLLDRLTKLMDNRYRVLAEARCRDIESYNEKFSDKKMKRVVLFIDELADLIKTSKKAVEDSIVRIAQKARACGIHLVIATQYPVADVVTGLIKQNMPTKVCFAVTTPTASCVMLGKGGAEKLIGKGDMLYQTEKDINPIRLQGGLVTERDINNVVYELYQNQI